MDLPIVLLHQTHTNPSSIAMSSSLSCERASVCLCGSELLASRSLVRRFASNSLQMSSRTRKIVRRNMVVFAVKSQESSSKENSGLGQTKSKVENSNENTRSRVSTSVAPPTPFPAAQPQFGSPVLWIGVGVGISIVFSWAAKKVQGYAMQQALKSMLEQGGQAGNPFLAGQGGNPFLAGQGGNPFLAGQGGNPFAGQGGPFFPGEKANPFAGMPPGNSPFTQPTPSSSFSPAQTSPGASTTVDVSPVTVSSPQSEAQSIDEKYVKTKRPAFTDVDINTLPEDKPIVQDQSTSDSPQKPPFADAEVVDNTTRFSGSSTNRSQDTSENGKNKSFISIEMMEAMLEDPNIQKMVFPYLPEEMRDPVTFKRMIQLPQVRQQLQEALNNMGGEDGIDMLKYMNSDTVKQQFDQIGLTPEEVVGKILSSPDISASLQNPKVVEAIMDCSQNPLNITKYQNDPEVMNALLKIAELFPGATGSPY